MHDNPIVKEVRKARREILESYGRDYRAMLRDMMAKQWKCGHKVITAKGRREESKHAPGRVS